MWISPAKYLRTLLVVGLVVCGTACIAAQMEGGFGQNRGPAGGRRPGERMMGGAFPGLGGATELLRRDDVRKELELVDEQVQQLEQLSTRLRDRMREAFSGARDAGGGGEGNPDRMRQAFEKLNAEVKQELGKVLLPHQAKRLDQLALQNRMRGGGLMGLSGVAEQLGLTDEQRDKLWEKSQQVERELRKKMAELRLKSQDELLTILSPEQQAKIKEMVGEPFEFQEDANSPRFGGWGPGSESRKQN